MHPDTMHPRASNPLVLGFINAQKGLIYPLGTCEVSFLISHGLVATEERHRAFYTIHKRRSI